MTATLSRLVAWHAAHGPLFAGLGLLCLAGYCACQQDWQAAESAAVAALSAWGLLHYWWGALPAPEPVTPSEVKPGPLSGPLP